MNWIRGCVGIDVEVVLIEKPHECAIGCRSAPIDDNTQLLLIKSSAE
ncbi:hypothetical protein [Rhizobium sp. 18055]|nr:hypothetical protein [Rhizobium sp. 18055]